MTSIHIITVILEVMFTACVIIIILVALEIFLWPSSYYLASGILYKDVYFTACVYMTVVFDICRVNQQHV